MAYTASLVVNTVFGDQRVQHYYVTADAASGTVSTGLSIISSLQWSPASCTTNNSVIVTRVRKNATAGGTASNGTVGISGLVAGDEIYVVVYGN